MVLLSKMKSGITELDKGEWKTIVRNRLTEKREEVEQLKIAEAVTQAAQLQVQPERRFPFRFL
jgi:hypothetical protein